MKNLNYKFRIYPTSEQIEIFEINFRTKNFLWNYFLNQFKKKEKLSKVSEIRKQNELLQNADSELLYFTYLDFKKTVNNFFKKQIKKINFKDDNNYYQSYTTRIREKGKSLLAKEIIDFEKSVIGNFQENLVHLRRG